VNLELSEEEQQVLRLFMLNTQYELEEHLREGCGCCSTCEEGDKRRLEVVRGLIKRLKYPRLKCGLVPEGEPL